MPLPPHRIWRPAAYQGASVSRRYFEGWYYKHVDAESGRTIAIIPGVSFSADGAASHSFVQVVPSDGNAHYFAYPIDHFRWDARDPYRVSVGGNYFDRHGISLDLADDECVVTGAVRYGPWDPWPVTLFSPGIMGWYRFVPRMETYHGVLSMDHSLLGSITIDDSETCFDHGRGYVEKDWGRSFPSSWIWAQSNSFAARGTSVMVSVAKIPWMGGSFVGNIAGLLHDGELRRFATYTGARIKLVETGENEARVVVGDRREELEVHLHGCETLILKAPVLGAMEGRDAESLGGIIDVTLHAVRGGRAAVVFAGTGHQAGIEIMNDLDELRVSD
jgi:hypothetical protein